jgi:hypothetical protein
VLAALRAARRNFGVIRPVAPYFWWQACLGMNPLEMAPPVVLICPPQASGQTGVPPTGRRGWE